MNMYKLFQPVSVFNIDKTPNENLGDNDSLEENNWRYKKSGYQPNDPIVKLL